MKKILLLLVLSTCLMACDNQDDASPISLYTDFLGKNVLYSNDIYPINIEARSLQGKLTGLNISTFDSERGNVTVMDSALAGKSLSHTFYYRAPQLKNDSTTVTLTLSVTNTDGERTKLVYPFLCIQRDYALEETSGITLYCVETDSHPNGLCLKDLKPLMVSLADSADIDLYTLAAIEEETTITREWRTNTDIYFARVNTFDYGNATQRSVTETFASSIGNPRINGLKNDDIILVGHGNQAIGAIKIIHVFDEPGTENDRYLINIKKIKK